MDVTTLGCDFLVSSGYKWMLGPYGTGIFLGQARMERSLAAGGVYWMALEGAHNFGGCRSMRCERGPAPGVGTRRRQPASRIWPLGMLSLQVACEHRHRKSLRAQYGIDSHADGAPCRTTAVFWLRRAEEEKRGQFICIASRDGEKTSGALREVESGEDLCGVARRGAARFAVHLQYRARYRPRDCGLVGVRKRGERLESRNVAGKLHAEGAAAQNRRRPGATQKSGGIRKGMWTTASRSIGLPSRVAGVNFQREKASIALRSSSGSRLFRT